MQSRIPPCQMSKRVSALGKLYYRLYGHAFSNSSLSGYFRAFHRLINQDFEKRSSISMLIAPHYEISWRTAFMVLLAVINGLPSDAKDLERGLWRDNITNSWQVLYITHVPSNESSTELVIKAYGSSQGELVSSGVGRTARGHGYWWGQVDRDVREQNQNLLHGMGETS